MKKLFFAICALATLTFASCEKEPIGGTATEKMAGQWAVTLQHCDADGNLLYGGADLFGIGEFLVLTFNDALNSPDSLFIQDYKGAFWDFKVKAACDQANGTFAIKAGYDYQNGIDVDVINGKILRGAAKTPSGMPADSIVFEIAFSDDPYVGSYYDHHRITGYRYTGLAGDE